MGLQRVRSAMGENAVSDRPDTTLLHPVWSGEFTIFGVTLHCHVLSDGRRIIEADDVIGLFEAMGGDVDEADEPGVEELARWLHAMRAVEPPASLDFDWAALQQIRKASP